MKKTILPAGLVLVFLLTSCITTGGSNTDPIAQRPGWVTSYPTESGYFVGIGSSNTGNLSHDSEAAKAKALADLAASISVQIKGEISGSYSEDSLGKMYSSMEQKIKQNVDQNLIGVETAGTWNSDDDGSWVYLRMNIAEWVARKEQAKQGTRDRVQAIITPAWESGTLTGRLTALWKAREIVTESPYMGTIEAELFDHAGVLIDLLETEIQSLLESTAFHIPEKVLVMEIGRPVNLVVNVVNDSIDTVGTFPIIIAPAGDDSHVLKLQSDDDGVYDAILNFPSEKTGKVNYRIDMDLAELGIVPEQMFQAVIAPGSDFLLDVQPISAVFTVIMEDGTSAEMVQNRLRSLFSDILPVKFTEKDGLYAIECVLKFFQYPESKYTKNMKIIDAYAQISISKAGQTLVSRETPKYKDGGLDVTQAKEKSLDKLMKNLREEEDLIRDLQKAFALD